MQLRLVSQHWKPNMTITWKINNLEPQTSDGLVTVVHWGASAVDGEVSADGHNWTMGAYANDYLEKNWVTSYGGRGGTYDAEGTRSIANNKDGFIKRIWSFLSYSFFSSFYALFGRYDVAIASSGPITVGLPGLIAKHIRRKKLVFEVRDLWPQGAIELGIIKNPIVISFAYWFEKFCYQSADLIICLSPGMRDEILAKIQNRRVVSVCNAANIELFSNGIQVDLNKYDLQRKKYAIYSGNIGKVNNVEWMVEAAKHLTLMGSEMKIAFIGDGQLSE